MNTANKLTVLRCILIPIFVVVLCLDFPLHRFVGLFIFLLACITDSVDGRIARNSNQITDFGKFFDPIADKMLVLSAMLIFIGWGWMPAWIVIVVIAREFIVSALRMVAAVKGRVIAAGWSGKVKTAATMICIAIMLLGLAPVINIICSVVILITTVYSGAEYFIKNRDMLNWDDI